jgi:hypothetical protein
MIKKKSNPNFFYNEEDVDFPKGEAEEAVDPK